jgi:uncharacterized membrane protein
MSIFIMLNNFFHDFAVAMLFACLLVLVYIQRLAKSRDFEQQQAFAFGVYRALSKIIIACWVIIVVGGVIRTLAYQEFEWMESAGRGQVLALMIKHVLLLTFVIFGTALQLRLRKVFRKSRGEGVTQ